MANSGLEFLLKGWDGKAQFLPLDLLKNDWTGAKDLLMLHSPVWELWWLVAPPVLGQNSRLFLLPVFGKASTACLCVFA